MKQDTLRECIPAESLPDPNACQITNCFQCVSYPNFVPSTVKYYYKFSKYLNDPNRFRFKKGY